MTYRRLILLLSVLLPLIAVAADPLWLESDSADAVAARMASDFSLTRGEAVTLLKEKYPSIDEAVIDSLIADGTIESVIIGGERMIHRKAPRNLGLLDSRFGDAFSGRGSNAAPRRLMYCDSVLRGKDTHEVTYRFTIDVPWHEALRGDTLRVWMPLPRRTRRQPQVEVLSAFPQKYVISPDSASVHKSIYFEAPVTDGDTAHFEYVCRFTTRGEYFPPDRIRSDIRPYNTRSIDYIRYTAEELPHIVRVDSLAAVIAGDETDPYRLSELAFDYIVSCYPWAGAREYSTIPCIPRYVLEAGHGDCGQVALLYISIMRSLGVPARWESGWMLHPGEKNLHDWAEVYFEGVGWVPVDVSFGRYSGSGDPAVRDFYSTGIDSHRLAANSGVCGEFYPPKRFIRSETVDFQLGEVECSRGNLFYPGWLQHLQILEQKTVWNQE